MAQTNLAEKVAEYFEAPSETEEGMTLARHVSDALIPVMPRISPALFGLEREVSGIELDEEQREIILEDFDELGFGSKFEYPVKGQENTYSHERVPKNSEGSIHVETKGKTPLFFYGEYDREEVSYKRKIDINLIHACKFDISTSSFGEPKIRRNGFLISLGGNGNYDDYLQFSPHTIQPGTGGKIKLKTEISWKVPYKLDVAAKAPEVPEKLIELGNEAISTYHDFLRKAPKDLKRTTSLQTPDIGVLWVPDDKSLYVAGKIPKPIIIPVPRKDSVLVMDIPDGDKSYRHAVAAWDIGEELPFRNWLAEYTERAEKPELRSYDGGKK